MKAFMKYLKDVKIGSGGQVPDNGNCRYTIYDYRFTIFDV